MLLAIDVGNTNLQLGVFGDDCELLADWRLSTERERTADEMGLLVRSLFRHVGLEADGLSGIILASVVPPLTGVIVEAGRKYFDLDPLVVSAALVTDLPVKYEPPGDVGADRLVNAIAVRDKYRVPAIVVDFGTATTFDVIDGEGAYLGGVIATGIGVSANALFARAARLPRVDIARPERVIGRTTVGSVQSGLLYGYVDLVDGLIDRIASELGGDPFVVATGGWAAVIGPECRRIQEVDPLLTLHGLRLIWQRHGADG
jgi:type III pantothenate kinase